MKGVKKNGSSFAPADEANDDASEFPVSVAGGNNQRILT